MTETKNPIDQKAIDSLAVAPLPPQENDATHPDQSAGQDSSIAERLRRDPSCVDAKLDCGLDESMDASDPPAITQPGKSSDPAPSSGFDQATEDARQK